MFSALASESPHIEKLFQHSTELYPAFKLFLVSGIALQLQSDIISNKSANYIVMADEAGSGSSRAPELTPELPPHLADLKGQSVDDVVRDLKKSPFFMTSLDDAPADEDNPELDAIKALMYEGTRLENAENFREQGNEFARAKKWKDGKELYTKGLVALKAERREGDPTGEDEIGKEDAVKELLLVNRALCHLELRTSPRSDCDFSLRP